MTATTHLTHEGAAPSPSQKAQRSQHSTLGVLARPSQDKYTDGVPSPVSCTWTESIEFVGCLANSSPEAAEGREHSCRDRRELIILVKESASDHLAFG